MTERLSVTDEASLIVEDYIGNLFVIAKKDLDRAIEGIGQPTLLRKREVVSAYNSAMDLIDPTGSMYRYTIVDGNIEIEK